MAELIIGGLTGSFVAWIIYAISDDIALLYTVLKKIKNILPLLIVLYAPIDIVDLGTEGFTCQVKSVPKSRVELRRKINVPSVPVNLSTVTLPTAYAAKTKRIPLSHEVPLTGKFLFFSKKEIPSLKSRVKEGWYGYCVDCGLKPELVSLGIPVQPATIEILRMYGVTHTPSLVEVTGKELIIYEKDFN